MLHHIRSSLECCQRPLQQVEDPTDKWPWAMALQGLAYPASIWTSHGNTLLKGGFFLGNPRKTQWGDSPAVFDDTRGP